LPADPPGRTAVWHAVAAWAGPWPVEERWWDPQRAQRVARFQLLSETGQLVLAGLDNQQWYVYAQYE
jgi:protein ImuB